MKLLTSWSELAEPIPHILTHVAICAHQLASPAWLIGGSVRDLALGLPLTHDLDVALEGDAIHFAQALAHTLGATITTTHPAFSTASLAFPSSPPIAIDLTRTRIESYPTIAALPIIQPASIRDDLRRRDFTLNALALSITLDRSSPTPRLAQPTLLDPHNGLCDVYHHQLRVLHDASFDDDPTRILRGVRLATRHGFAFEPHTLTLLTRARDLGRIEMTSPDRIRTELCLALHEPSPESVMYCAHTLGLLPHISPNLQWCESISHSCRRAHTLLALSPHDSPNYRAELFAGLLTYHLPLTGREHCIAYYHLPRPFKRLLLDVAAIQQLRESLVDPHTSAGTIDRLLARFGDAALDVVACAEGEPIATIIRRFSQLRSIQPILDGHALKQLGVPPGPQIARLLAELRAARIDGILQTRQDEEAWVRRSLTTLLSSGSSPIP